MQNGGFGEIVERTIRKCADCGKPFRGSRDFFKAEDFYSSLPLNVNKKQK